MALEQRSSNTSADAMREAAALWHDRLQREAVEESVRCQFEQWLAEDAGHRAAYEAVDKAWRYAQSRRLDPQILALRHETALRLTRRTSSSRRVSRLAAAAVLVVAVAGLIAFWAGFSVPQRDLTAANGVGGFIQKLLFGARDRYVTAIGERLAVALPDGSQVTLNTHSEIELVFNDEERTVRLKRGQAFFEVAKDPSRPFAVEAQARRFVALGTSFDVRLAKQSVQITMVEGSVRVERAARKPHGQPSTASKTQVPAVRSIATLTAGEQLTSGAEDRVTSADAARITSWKTGQVIFEGERLADAIAELNRYSATQIELNDPALAELRISGAFATGRPAVFVEALATYFPILVDRSDADSIVLDSKR